MLSSIKAVVTEEIIAHINSVEIHYLDNAPNDTESELLFDITFINNSSKEHSIINLESFKYETDKWIYLKMGSDSIEVGRLKSKGELYVNLPPKDTITQVVVINPLLDNVGVSVKDIFLKNESHLKDDFIFITYGIFNLKSDEPIEIRKADNFSINYRYNSEEIDIDTDSLILKSISLPDF